MIIDKIVMLHKITNFYCAIMRIAKTAQMPYKYRGWGGAGTSDESVNQAILYFDRQHAKDEGMGLPESDGYIDVEIGGQPAKWGSYGYNDALNSESDNAGLKRADVVGLVPYNNQVYYLSYSISFFDRKAADEPLKEFEVFDKSISFK